MMFNLGYAAFIGAALAWYFAMLYGPPYWRAVMIGVAGGIGTYFVGVGYG